MGTRQIYDSSAAFDLKSLNLILRRMSQGLQVGGMAPGWGARGNPRDSQGSLPKTAPRTYLDEITAEL
jgi:hypothetical protein